MFRPMTLLLRRFLPALLCVLATLGHAELPPAAAATAKPCGPVSASAPVAPILPSGFLGWTNAYRLQNDLAEAVLVPEIGRLVHFAPRQGSSLFRLDPARQGQVPAKGEPFFNIGGDWFWPVSQARWASFSEDGKDWPPPAPLADLPWTGSAWTDADGAQCARFTRAYGPPLNLEASRLFRLAPGSAALEVHQRIERTAPSDIPVVLWNISQIAQAGHIVLPVEKKSKFRGGLKALMGRKPGRKQLADCGDAAVYRVSPGAETKLGSDSPRGWIAAARGTHVIVESVVNPAAGDYPDGGCVVEVYSNHGLGYSEIETLSPELLLDPGTVLENILQIELATTQSPLDACKLADAVRALAGP